MRVSQIIWLTLIGVVIFSKALQCTVTAIAQTLVEVTLLLLRLLLLLLLIIVASATQALIVIVPLLRLRRLSVAAAGLGLWFGLRLSCRLVCRRLGHWLGLSQRSLVITL